MDPDVKKLWVDALRSGKYKQGTYALHVRDQTGEWGGDKYCCLGVLCELAVEAGVPITKYGTTLEYQYDGNAALLPSRVDDWAGQALGKYGSLVYSVDDYISLANMNDDGYSFDQIADVIERQF